MLTVMFVCISIMMVTMFERRMKTIGQMMVVWNEQVGQHKTEEDQEDNSFGPGVHNLKVPRFWGFRGIFGIRICCDLRIVGLQDGRADGEIKGL